MDKFEYRNCFNARCVERQDVPLIIGQGKMPKDMCLSYTIKLSDAFFVEFKKYCIGPSRSMCFAWALDSEIDYLIRENQALLVSAADTVSIIPRKYDHICEVRAKQNDLVSDYKNLRLPHCVLVRAKSLIEGCSVAKGIETIVQNKFYRLQQENQTCFVRWQG